MYTSERNVISFIAQDTSSVHRSRYLRAVYARLMRGWIPVELTSSWCLFLTFCWSYIWKQGC